MSKLTVLSRTARVLISETSWRGFVFPSTLRVPEIESSPIAILSMNERKSGLEPNYREILVYGLKILFFLKCN